MSIATKKKCFIPDNYLDQFIREKITHVKKQSENCVLLNFLSF